jgi:ribonuclease J
MAPFVIEAFHVCHSIPDGMGLAIETPRGLIVHSGDFKFDPTPVDGRKTDAVKLRELGERGVLALISDSTNTEQPGETPSEREVQGGLDAAFSQSKGRIIATAFASNVHRFQMLLEAGARAGRKVATLGMSMTYNMDLAHEMGYLDAPPNTWVSFDELKNLPPQKSVLVTTGSQGEPMSGLALMASGQHANVQVRPGDALVYCARIIPGNERTVNKVINDFHRRGAQVCSSPAYMVHVSGHGYAGDQRRLMELVRPRFFLPAHGEMRHQVSHKTIAQDAGLPAERVYVLDNGQRWTWDGREARVQGMVPSGEVLVDGKGVGDIGDVVLRDRKHLSEDGVVLCLLGMTRKGEVISGPDIISRGFVYERSNEDVLEEARGRVRDSLAGMNTPDHTPGWDEVRAIVSQCLKRYFKQKFDRRPMILPVVMEL